MNLLPCPFCGCTEHRVHEQQFSGIIVKLMQVECGKCGALGPPHIDRQDENRVEAVWNKRETK